MLPFIFAANTKLLQHCNIQDRQFLIVEQVSVVQKQIEIGTRMRQKSAQLQLGAETRVAELEDQLHAATAQAKELRRQAKSVTEDVNKEARKLQRLEDQVSRGHLTVPEAVEELKQVRDKLPEVKDAQRRLLGLQMGASAEVLPLQQASDISSDSDAEYGWIPRVGEEVLVCTTHASSSTLNGIGYASTLQMLHFPEGVTIGLLLCEQSLLMSC